jgi:hypothetical protein
LKSKKEYVQIKTIQIYYVPEPILKFYNHTSPRVGKRAEAKKKENNKIV